MHSFLFCSSAFPLSPSPYFFLLLFLSLSPLCQTSVLFASFRLSPLLFRFFFSSLLLNVCQKMSNVFFSHAHETPQNTLASTLIIIVKEEAVSKRRKVSSLFFFFSSRRRCCCCCCCCCCAVCVSRAVEWHWPFLEEQHSRRRFPRWKEDYEEDSCEEFYRK